MNAGKTSQFLLPEAYVKGRFGALEVYAGRRREIMGLTDTTGTMGSYIWSGNALPVPKIDIGFRQFVPLLKNGLISVKGNFAHGWLGSGDSVQNVLLHQKSLYLRLGKPQWKIRVIAGFNHQAQWGGRPAKPYVDRISGQLITQYDVSFENYLRVVSGVSVGAQTGLTWDDIDGLPGNEAGNRVGNHLGSIDIGTEFEVGRYRVKIYRQSIYEDGSLFYLSNISDGLTGLSLSGGKDFNLCLEYLDTRHQGGEIYYGNIPELRGRDDYFNNSVYRDAWTYQGKAIGNPLLNPYHENPDVFPAGRKYIPNYIYNNRVQAFHVYAQYTILGNLSLSTRILSAVNYGSYLLPLDLRQFSFRQTAKVPMAHFDLLVSLAGDAGKYYPASYGLQVGIRKQW
ncbi:MAG: capsule assembly Wzi family protein [Leadbetterella sp.]|nr:capsule assembly Wzi family protein [Leadbetterella sp.]